LGNFITNCDDGIYNKIYRIKYNFREIEGKYIDEVQRTMYARHDHFHRPYYVDFIPFKDEEGNVLSEDLNENSVLFGLGQYINEYYKDYKLRKKAEKILRACEDDLSKIPEH
jgi:hypothetical protein